MINIDLSELVGNMYGMGSTKEFLQGIEEMKRSGFSDAEIQKILDRSKEGDKHKPESGVSE